MHLFLSLSFETEFSTFHYQGAKQKCSRTRNQLPEITTELGENQTRHRHKDIEISLHRDTDEKSVLITPALERSLKVKLA